MDEVATDESASESVVLSDRQRETLVLVGKGLTSKEIARELGISPSTVDNHIRAAADRLGARSRFEAARVLNRAESTSNHEVSSIHEDVLQRSVQGAAVDWRRIPPIGGKPNLLSLSQRLFGMLQIALLCAAVSAGLILTIAGVVHVLR